MFEHVSFCRYNQVNAIRMACRTGIIECLNLTNTWFKQWMDFPEHNLLVLVLLFYIIKTCHPSFKMN